MSDVVVTATLLNVRRVPAIEPGNIVGRLGQGQRVKVIGGDGVNWHEIQANALRGFASARFLSPAPAADAPISAVRPPPRVDFPPNAGAQLNSPEKRHCPLGSLTPRARGNGLSATDLIALYHSIVTELNVTGSTRYMPSVLTFCNIYAYDVCYLSGVYLPRVWWKDKALLAISQGNSVPVEYDKTVRELNANSLHDWLMEWGDDFGWEQCQTLDELQQRANAGALGVISAKRMDLSKSGHIVVVLGETTEHSAQRVPAGIVAPLQSQAGRVNKQFFASRWWTNPEMFRAVGFWVHH